MNNLLYILAILLVALWAIGFYVYETPEIIHTLLIIAVLIVAIKLTKGKKIT